MTRVATLPLQNTLANAMQRNQQSLADSNMQLNSTFKVQDYAGLGDKTASVMSAKTMLAQQQAQSAVADRVNTTLGLYQNSLGAIDDSVSALKTKLLNAIGTGDSPDLGSAIQSAFDNFRDSLNTNEAGVPIFAGGQTDSAPFVPQTLSDMVGLDPNDAFANDDTKTSARLGDDIDVQYGIGASDVGTGLAQAFSTLAALGPFGDKLTDDQVAGIKTAMGQIDTGLSQVRAVDAQNGDTQNEVETLGKRADDRANLLTNVVGDAVDADMGQVAVDISARTTILNASYAAFDKLNGLSLLNFLDT
jgi:flagellar hook-associated protein 3 FlgL